MTSKKVVMLNVPMPDGCLGSQALTMFKGELGGVLPLDVEAKRWPGFQYAHFPTNPSFEKGRSCST